MEGLKTFERVQICQNRKEWNCVIIHNNIFSFAKSVAVQVFYLKSVTFDSLSDVNHKSAIKLQTTFYIFLIYEKRFDASWESHVTR